jgi:hypothetical protein
MRAKEPPGFGVSQLAGAFRSGASRRKRQRAAALQDSVAATGRQVRFMIPMRAEKSVDPLYELERRPPARRVPAVYRAVPEAGAPIPRFTVPMRGANAVEALHGPPTVPIQAPRRRLTFHTAQGKVGVRPLGRARQRQRGHGSAVGFAGRSRRYACPALDLP